MGRLSRPLSPLTPTSYRERDRWLGQQMEKQPATTAATVAVGTSPSGIAVDEKTNFIYIANAGNTQNPGNVTVINGATNATTTLSDPKAVSPVAIAADSATNKIYVANSGSNNVTVIDGAH